MASYKILFTKSARDDLSGLSSDIASRILDKLEFFLQKDNPLRYAKHLQNSRFGQYRFRIGEYRVLFDVSSEGVITILLILRIKHRKDVYRGI